MYLSRKSLVVLGASVLAVLALNVRQSLSVERALDEGHRVSQLVAGPLHAYMHDWNARDEDGSRVKIELLGGVDNAEGLHGNVGRIRNR